MRQNSDAMDHNLENMEQNLDILYEDNHLIFVNKPAGLLAQGDISGDVNLLDQLKEYRKRHENKPGEAFVGLVQRLDRPVSGVMVLAKTSKAAQRLNASWHSESVVKTYRAVVRSSEQLPDSDWTVWQDWVVKDRETNRVQIYTEDETQTAKAQFAELKIRTIDVQKNRAEVQIELGTGRGHQIRVQLATRGLVIIGDSKYGSKDRYMDTFGHSRVALHAESLTVVHPTLKHELTIAAPMPYGWPMPSN